MSGKGNLAYIQEQTDQNQPDSWKGYNISNAAKVDNDPNSLMRQWRHDDEEVAYPTFELIEKNYRKLKSKKPGFNNICVHKGLGAGSAGSAARPSRRLAQGGEGLAEPELHHLSRVHPAGDVPLRLARRRSAPGRLREGVPDISWTTEYAVLAAPFKNIYAEIGTTWASSVVTFPTVAAHILGQLMKFMGPDRIRLRLGLGLVRIAAVADRCVLAVPDSRGDAQEVWLSRTDASMQSGRFSA